MPQELVPVLFLNFLFLGVGVSVDYKGLALQIILSVLFVFCDTQVLCNMPHLCLGAVHIDSHRLTFGSRKTHGSHGSAVLFFPSVQ